MGLWAAPRKTRARASAARAPLRLALSLGSPCSQGQQKELVERKEELRKKKQGLLRGKEELLGKKVELINRKEELVDRKEEWDLPANKIDKAQLIRT